MEKLIDILKRNWTYPVGAIAGAMTGYLYWYFVGCESGTCPITASPTNSIIWSAVMGALLFSLLRKEPKKDKNDE